MSINFPSAPAEGTAYTFNGVTYTFTSGVWMQTSAYGSSVQQWSKAATAGQTVFSGADDNGVTLATNGLWSSVFLNGRLLSAGFDYTLTATAVTLLAAAKAGDACAVVTINAALAAGGGVVTYRASDNLAINGAVDVSAELGFSNSALVNAAPKYTADQWIGYYGNAGGVLTSGQSAVAAALPGFQSAHQLKATTAISALADNDLALHWVRIEGYRVAHLGWGAAGALPIAVAFRFYSTAAGVAFVKLANAPFNRVYYHEIMVAAGWNFYAFEVPGDTAGAWEKTTNVGLSFTVFVAGKAAAPASVFDAWGANNQNQTTNSTNLLAANNNLTQVTGLFIAQASGQLPAAADLPRLMRPFDQESILCKRYFQNYNRGLSNIFTVNAVAANTDLIDVKLNFQEMRVSPALLTSGTPGDYSVSDSAGSGGGPCTAIPQLFAGSEGSDNGWLRFSRTSHGITSTARQIGSPAGFLRLDARL